jgi:DNA-binding PadR family transcriptional regulator
MHGGVELRHRVHVLLHGTTEICGMEHLDVGTQLEDLGHGLHTGYSTGYGNGGGWSVSVRHALLALLSEGPKYGLQLRQEFEAGTGEVWPLNVGQVYMTLQRLERDGLVVSEGAADEGPQKSYRLTEAGSDELVSWLGPPPDTGVPPRDELVIKVLVALRVPGVDVVELVQAHRRRLVETMQYFTGLKADADEGDVGLLLVVDAEIFRLDAVIRWLDSAEARLRHGADLRFPSAPLSPVARRRRRQEAPR